jgi:hypothetical protein
VTTMRSGLHVPSADRTTAARSSLQLSCDIEWPCLARACRAGERARRGSTTDELLLRVRCRLEGAPLALRGRLVIETSPVDLDGTIETLADLPLRGSYTESDHWRLFACVAECAERGPLSIDALIPSENEGRRCDATSGPWHVRADVMRWLAIPGGRYGVPALLCRVTEHPTANACGLT